MAPKVETRADFPKGPKGTQAFKNYKLSKLYRTVKGKKVAKNVLKIGSRGKLLGKGLLAAQMYKTGKDALKPFQKGPDGKRRGIAGVIQRASQNVSKKDKEMKAKGYVKDSRGRYKKVNKAEKPVNKQKTTVNKQKSTITKISAKQFDSRKTKVNKAEKPVNKQKETVNKQKETVNKPKVSTTNGGTKPPSNPKTKTEVKKTNPLDKYRRTKGEGVGKKTKDQRGDTRITKGLKKAGFTETRLAKLRQKNAAFQKAKKGGKKAMAEYRKKYPKRG